MFEDLSSAERIELAKTKMAKVLDHFLYIVELHANNAFVVHSPTLASQIPASFAANAFNVFQRSMYQIEIVRLCAIWDRASRDRESALLDTSIILKIDAPLPTADLNAGDGFTPWP